MSKANLLRIKAVKNEMAEMQGMSWWLKDRHAQTKYTALKKRLASLEKQHE